MNPTDDSHELTAPGITVRVAADGAELCAIRDATGLEYLWPAGPEWPRHAPLLFPIVGRLRDDRLVHDGQAHRMTQHGFARDRRFTWVQRDASACSLSLGDDAATRAMFPFGFRFDVGYAVSGSTVEATMLVTNTGSEVLPASMGAHPAFRWPLSPGVAKEAYALTFDAVEAAPICGVAGGLLSPDHRPSPIQGRTLSLNEALFADDALIMDRPASRSVRYAADTGPSLTMAWDGFEQLGLWAKPGADFLCIEPWCGMASPADFSGDFADKPWLMLIPPGDSRTARFRITLGPVPAG